MSATAEPPPPQPPFGRALQEARERLGLNVRQASIKAGISEGRWRQLEMGYQRVASDVFVPANPKVSTLRRVAAAVGLDLRLAFEKAGLPVPADVLAQPQVESPGSAVGGDGQDEEIVLRLPVKPGTSARRREQMRRIAEASARAAVEALDDEES